MSWGDSDKLASGTAAPTANWGKDDKPVAMVGSAAMAGRQFVAGGGDLLNALDLARRAMNPGSAIDDALTRQAMLEHAPAGMAPDEVTRQIEGAIDPVQALARRAQGFSDLQSDEMADSLGARVAGGVGRLVPNIAGAMAAGPASLESMLPEALARTPVLGKALLAVTRGAPTAAAFTTEQAANLPDDMTPVEKAKATVENAGLNLAMAGLPAAIGSGPITRTLTGGAIGAALPAATAAIQGQPQDAASNIVGALTGALLAQHGGAEHAPVEDPAARAQFNEWAANHRPETVAPPLALPADAAINGEFTVGRRPEVPVSPGPIAVTPEGNAFTPAQGHSELAQALTTALGRTPQQALPAPTIAVDSAGTARTSADFLSQAKAAQDAADEKRNLGITPDIERSQAVRWGKQDQQIRQADAVRQRLDEIDQRESQLDAENKMARGRNAQPDPQVDDALTFLSKLGGLDRADFQKQGLDPKQARLKENTSRGGAGRPLFRATGEGGMTHDQAAEQLWQHGYIPDYDGNHALEVIFDGLAGDPHETYSIHRKDQGDRMALEAERRDIASQPVNDTYADVPFSRRPSFSFAGERAHTADRGALAQAQQMEAMGRDSVPDRLGNQPGSPEDTHMATGWHRGVDGKWKFEIDDSAASIKPDFQRHLGEVDRLQKERARLIYPEDGHRPTAEELHGAARLDRQATQMQTGLTLDKLLDHSPLMEAYPELADVRVRIDPDMKGYGAYSPSDNSITIRSPDRYEPEHDGSLDWTSANTGTGDRTLKSVLLHEIQHAIQTREGFARGGNVSEFEQPRLAERDRLHAAISQANAGLSKAHREGDTARYEQLMVERRELVRQLHEKGLADDIDIRDRSSRDYQRLAGEVEARNTQTRLDMSAEDRRVTPPTETADVSREKQIVRLNSEPGERRAEHDDREVTDRYSRILSRYVGGDVRFTPSTDVPHAVSRALAEFDRVFGGRTVVVQNHTPEALDVQGLTLRDGNRLVNRDADAPLLSVASHEMLHQMQRDRPDLYEELEAEIRRQGRLDDFGAVLHARAQASGEKPGAISDKTVREELVADAVGDALTDPEFIDRLAQRNPSLFAKVAEYFKKALDTVLSRLKDLGSSKYLRDVKAFRDKLADVLQRYAEGRPRQEAPADSPMFSRRPHGEQFDNLDDAPSRRPGESQADYVRRVMRKARPEIAEATAIAKAQRGIGRLGMRAMWAKQDRALAIADHAFAQYRKLFDKEDQVINLRTIDQWENGQRITDADARDFFNAMKAAFDERTAKIQALAPDAMQQLIDHYFPHIWEDSGKAMKWYQGFSAKKPLQGDRSFLKQRVHATIKDGMATGLKPVSTNPVDLAMLKLGQMDKFIAFHEFRQDLQQRGWLKTMQAGERVPVGYARVDDPAFQIAGGLQGYHAVPELIAKDINNYLSPSLYRFGAWKALRTVQNVLMSSRLGLSMFHGGFTTMDNLVMHADVAGRRLINGDIPGGLATLLKAPLSIAWSPIEGGHLNKQWLGLKPSDVHTAAIMDMLEQGGAHMKMSATDYNNAIPKLIKAVRQKSAGGALKQTFPAIGEAISWVIHHKLVPNQKMAARVMLAKFELDRIAGALGKERGDYAGIANALHPDALKQIGAHVVDLVDDRLGQMNYDNQFWNKTAREVAQAAIGAVGWQVGTLRTVTGGARDLAHLWSPEKLLSSLDKEGNINNADFGRVSGRLTYLVTLALLMGGLSAATQYLLTGEGPQEIKDYFFPKTGNKNDDGSDERLQWPSYWSDHYKLGTHPLQTAMHKVNPSIGMLMEALSNQDYYGTEIRNPDDAWYKQAAEVGEYLAKGFIPYSITGADKLRDAKTSTARQVANFFGVTKAPASVSRSPFQAFVADKAYDAIPKGARSQQQAAHTKAMHDAEAAVRRGDDPDMTGLSEADRRNVDKAARQAIPAIRFRRLGIEDKLRAYELATPKERKDYGLGEILIRSNWRKSIRDLPEDEQDSVIAKMQAIEP